ncbi:7909_t:CDS:1, partial [Racocetra fulgida]
MTNDDNEYLMVELVEIEPDSANVRNLGKRKKNEMVVKRPNKRGRPNKILEVHLVESSSFPKE